MSEHELWNELGNLYFLSGEYRQAVHAYKRSIQMDESFGRPYSNLALTYVQQGEYEQAIDLYRRSIELLSEDKEKAISWNRLGNVFRHLKDYRQAVVAYRNADELDAESGEGGDKPGWLTEPAHDERPERTARGEEALAVEDPFPYEAAQSEAERRSEPGEDLRATWAPIDPTLFQQDTFEALAPGSLTTWGDPNLETDDPDPNWPPDSGAEVCSPDVESDDLSRWIPIPEEEPLDLLEYSLEAVDLAAQVDEPLEAPEESDRRELFGDLQPEPPDPVPASIDAVRLTQVVGPLPAASETRTAADASEGGGVTTTEADIIVQEQRTTEFIAAAEPDDEAAIEPQPAGLKVKAEAAVGASAETTGIPAEIGLSAEPERDPEELRELESGLAKYRRVVQLNPKNARAWDTLGNLNKSAGQYKEALLAYQQAIENDPSKALFHHHLGLVYACEGRMDDAINAFQRVIEIEPDHPLAHATLGGYYRKKGLEELAQKHVGIAMKSIFDSENEYNRACLAAICGNTDQALELLRVALKNKQTYVDWILRDPDLDFIRQDPRFKQLISDYAR
ncbi:MAG: tetratricopeptide repeat protein [Chloroflexota bacterium]